MIIYVGSCQKQDKLIQWLTEKGLKLTKFKKLFKIAPKDGGNKNNYLEISYSA